MSSGSNPSTSAAYKNVVKGKLSLKGSKASAVSGVKRKKEETPAERQQREDEELLRLIANKKEAEARADEIAAKAIQQAKATSSTSTLTGLDKDAADKQSELDDIESDPTLTKAERDFQRAQRQRELDLIKKKIAKTHRQRVEEYNAYLSSLTEHNDIPRVGPG